MINGHGDDLHRYGKGQIRSNFSTNIPTPASHDDLMNYIAGRADVIRSYPEPEPITLERKIAEIAGTDSESVMVTAGATQAIYLIAESRRGSRSAIFAPTFREYQDACELAGHNLFFSDSIYGMRDSDNAWLCCPNNPTGQSVPVDELIDFISGSRRLNVIDAAYSSYTLKRTLTATEAVESHSTIMLKSLTKDFGVPGLRIGYAIGHPDLLRKIKQRRMPWAVGSIPIAAAEWLLDNRDKYAIDANALQEESLRLSAEMNRIGIATVETDTNFFLACLPEGRRAVELKEWLAATRGMLIRDASNFHGLTPSHFRIAAQTPAEGNALIEAINEWMQL